MSNRNHKSESGKSRLVLNERSQRLLKFLVERYIRDGQPVGSRTLSKDSGLDLSPASIRNVMADLEELGLINSPHTSAGRVPTVQGYRLFVDSLLTIKPLDEQAVRTLQDQIGVVEDSRSLLSSASALLSDVSSMAGIVMLPRREMVALRQVEFLPLSGKRVLVVLIINEREVQNRIIQTSRSYSASELQQAANYLNQSFAGRDLKSVREHLLGEMRQTRENMDQLMVAAIEMADKAFQPEVERADYVMAGQTNLMNYTEMGNIERLKQLFETFNRKRDVLHLLDQCLNSKGVQIFIGNESGYEALDDCSVVTAPYRLEGDVVGVLGVIGPTRMAYDRMIPIVDVTARLLGAALNQAK
jgi:heat-inducible transcriptional repressor